MRKDQLGDQPDKQTAEWDRDVLLLKLLKTPPQSCSISMLVHPASTTREIFNILPVIGLPCTHTSAPDKLPWRDYDPGGCRWKVTSGVTAPALPLLPLETRGQFAEKPFWLERGQKILLLNINELEELR